MVEVEVAQAALDLLPKTKINNRPHTEVRA
jgi:hypothetical protein